MMSLLPLMLSEFLVVDVVDNNTIKLKETAAERIFKKALADVKINYICYESLRIISNIVTAG